MAALKQLLTPPPPERSPDGGPICTHQRNHITRREWGGTAGIVVLTLVVPAALAAAGRTFGLPHNDDFTFMTTAVDYHRTGGFHLGGDEQMVLVGHVLWGQPFLRLFGGGVVALHLAGLAAAAIGLGACFLVLRQRSSARAALLGTACVALLPGYALLAGSFVTDVTAFAAQMVSLALGLAALDRRGGGRALLLGASLSAGVAAFSSRQTAVPALLAVAVAAVWQSAVVRRAWRTMAVDLGLILCASAAVATMVLWRFGLAEQAHSPTGRVGMSHVLAAVAAISTLALFLAPLSWLVARSALTRPTQWGAVALGVISTLYWLRLPLEGRDLLLGNLFTRRGANDGVIGGVKADIFPPWVWPGLQVLAMFGVLALLTLAWHHLTDVGPRLRQMFEQEGGAAGLLLAIFTLLALAAALAPAARGANIFDRYLWPAGAGIAAILVRQVPVGLLRRRSAAAGSLALLALLALVTAVSVTESISFDRARWNIGEQAVASGVPADLIDAGYEWTGHHAIRPLSRKRPAEVLTAVSWWSRLYSSGLPCVVVTASPSDDPRYALERRRSYDPPLSPRRHLFVSRLVVASSPRCK